MNRNGYPSGGEWFAIINNYIKNLRSDVKLERKRDLYRKKDTPGFNIILVACMIGVFGLSTLAGCVVIILGIYFGLQKGINFIKEDTLFFLWLVVVGPILIASSIKGIKTLFMQTQVLIPLEEYTLFNEVENVQFEDLAQRYKKAKVLSSNFLWDEDYLFARNGYGMHVIRFYDVENLSMKKDNGQYILLIESKDQDVGEVLMHSENPIPFMKVLRKWEKKTLKR